MFTEGLYGTWKPSTVEVTSMSLWMNWLSLEKSKITPYVLESSEILLTPSMQMVS